MTDETRVVAECFSREEIVAKMYDRNKSVLNAWERHVVDKYFKRKPALILDIGCGTSMRLVASSSRAGYNPAPDSITEAKIADFASIMSAYSFDALNERGNV